MFQRMVTHAWHVANTLWILWAITKIDDNMKLEQGHVVGEMDRAEVVKWRRG